MSIKDLYWILAIWHMRLPYWFIALVVVAFIVLFFMFLVMWRKKERYNRLYKTASSNLKKSKDEILYVTSMCSSKEEEIVKLKETIEISKKQILDKDGIIRGLNRKKSMHETSLNEKNEQYRICESEKLELLSKLQAKEENISKLNGTITLANEETQKIGKEKKQLESQLKNTQEILNQRINQFDVLEKKCSQAESQNKTLESSKTLLEKEIDELKATIKQQANAYQAEIRNLNLKVGRRDEKIEKMNEALTETQKELQAVRDEKSILEKKLQEIQETLKEKKQNKYMDKNENLVERIARW